MKECNLPVGSLLKSVTLVLYQSQQKIIETFEIWTSLLVEFGNENGHPLLCLKS